GSLEAIEHKPQPEHRGIEVAQARVVERARLGDGGEQLEGGADLVAQALGSASLAARAAVAAGAMLDRDADDDFTPVLRRAAVGRGAAVGKGIHDGGMCHGCGGSASRPFGWGGPYLQQ